MITFRPENSFECCIEGCNEEYPDDIELREHVQKHIAAQKPFKLKETFNPKSDIEIVTGPLGQPFKCYVAHCDKEYSKERGLINHLENHTVGYHKSEKSHKCTFGSCDKTVILKNIIKHMTAHTEKHPFKCPVPLCYKAFSEPSNLQRHITVHIANKPFECIICLSGFISQGKLTTHLFQDHPEDAKNTSVTDIEAIPESVEALSLDYSTRLKNSFECCVEGCDKNQSDNTELRKHIQEHIAEGRPFKLKSTFNPKSEIKMLTGPLGQSFKCYVADCSKNYVEKDALIRHLKSHKKASHKCTFEDCDKMIIRKDLKTHMTAHTEEKPFKCPVPLCQKKFSRIGPLKKHTILHITGKPFECDICLSGFAQKHKLIIHTKKDHQPSL